MDWIEVTARTVEEAKELALDRLGVVEDELEFEVLDEPTRGLFRRSDARIRARVKPLSREKPSDRRRRRRGAGNGAAGGGGGRNRGTGRRVGTAAAPAAVEAAPAAGASEAAGSPASAPSRARRRRGGRNRSRQGAPAGTSGANGGGAPVGNDDYTEAEVDVETVPVGAQAAHAEAFAAELVEAMGFAATVRSEVDDDDVLVRIEGERLGPLVGPRGVTLHALEEVVRAAVQHYAGGRSARVHVDVGGYRERRREALAAFAREVASDVQRTGAARALEPMNAADRKVVHDVVAEIDGVATASEGEEPRRRVVILPG